MIKLCFKPCEFCLASKFMSSCCTNTSSVCCLLLDVKCRCGWNLTAERMCGAHANLRSSSVNYVCWNSKLVTNFSCMGQVHVQWTFETKSESLCSLIVKVGMSIYSNEFISVPSSNKWKNFKTSGSVGAAVTLCSYVVSSYPVNSPGASPCKCVGKAKDRNRYKMLDLSLLRPNLDEQKWWRKDLGIARFGLRVSKYRVFVFASMFHPYTLWQLQVLSVPFDFTNSDGPWLAQARTLRSGVLCSQR